MQGWTFPEPWSPPLWMRIVGGSFFAIMTSLQAWKDFHSILWIQSLSLACFVASSGHGN
jgi:hypothetical protein